MTIRADKAKVVFGLRGLAEGVLLNMKEVSTIDNSGIAAMAQDLTVNELYGSYDAIHDAAGAS